MSPASNGGSMRVSVLIATYGDSEWEDLAWSRAWPSAQDQGALEVQVFHDPEGTIASVRNELAGTAKGEWLCFLDADDELAPGYLDAMKRVLEQESLGGRLLLTPAVQQVRNGRPSSPFFFDRGNPLIVDNWLVVGTAIQREVFHEVGGFSEYPHGFEDWSLWVKAVKAGCAIVKVPEAVYVAHVNPQSKHRQFWRNGRQQRQTHLRIQAELEQWQPR